MAEDAGGEEQSEVKCADGDLCQFGKLTVEKKYACTQGCGGYLHAAFCRVQEWKKRFLNKTSHKTHMCQQYAAKLGNTKLVYKLPIEMDKEESYLEDEHEKKDGKRHISPFNGSPTNLLLPLQTQDQKQKQAQMQGRSKHKHKRKQ
eukprot:2464033-Ditylum_brightwellii.AAC.1